MQDGWLESPWDVFDRTLTAFVEELVNPKLNFRHRQFNQGFVLLESVKVANEMI